MRKDKVKKRQKKLQRQKDLETKKEFERKKELEKIMELKKKKKLQMKRRKEFKRQQKKLKKQTKEEQKRTKPEACLLFHQCLQLLKEIVVKVQQTITRQLDETFDLLLLNARQVNACNCVFGNDDQLVMVKKKEDGHAISAIKQRLIRVLELMNQPPQVKLHRPIPNLHQLTNKRLPLVASNLVNIPLVSSIPRRPPLSSASLFTGGVRCPVPGCQAPPLGTVSKYYSHLYVMHFRRDLHCPVAGCNTTFGTFSLNLLTQHDDRRHKGVADSERKCPCCPLTFTSFMTAAFHAFEVHARGRWMCHRMKKSNDGRESACNYVATTRNEFQIHEKKCKAEALATASDPTTANSTMASTISTSPFLSMHIPPIQQYNPSAETETSKTKTKITVITK